MAGRNRSQSQQSPGRVAAVDASRALTGSAARRSQVALSVSYVSEYAPVTAGAAARRRHVCRCHVLRPGDLPTRADRIVGTARADGGEICDTGR